MRYVTYRPFLLTAADNRIDTSRNIHPSNFISTKNLLPTNNMNYSYGRDFTTLKNLINSRAGKVPAATTHEQSACPSDIFEFELRGQYEKHTIHQPTNYSLFQCPYIAIDTPAVIDKYVENSTDDSIFDPSCKECSVRSKLIQSLETAVLELQEENRRTSEKLIFWRTLLSRAVFYRKLTICACMDSDPDDKFLVMNPEEWFLYDNFAIDVDPLMCVSTKRISVSLDLDALTATVQEAAERKWIVYFNADRDMLKVFLAAISYLNIPINISEGCTRIYPDQIGSRE